MASPKLSRPPDILIGIGGIGPDRGDEKVVRPVAMPKGCLIGRDAAHRAMAVVLDHDYGARRWRVSAVGENGVDSFIAERL